MPKHEFGIMERPPIPGERYDRYEPERYNCICVDDTLIEGLNFAAINFYWHTLDVPGKGLAYCGITLIPPESMGAVIAVIQNISGLEELTGLFVQTRAKNKFVIHFGI